MTRDRGTTHAETVHVAPRAPTRPGQVGGAPGPAAPERPSGEPTAADFEKLGLFYLGRPYDPAAKRPKPWLSSTTRKDLVTHAVCVGMTGSGKTGLCLACSKRPRSTASPAIAIDPKGDLSNLLLTFPELRREDFAPWIDEGEARGGAHARRVRRAAGRALEEGAGRMGPGRRADPAAPRRGRVAIYTPGSTAGLPVSILKSFAAPPAAIRDDAELFRERVATTAAASSACSASTPTRCRAASTSCSPRSSDRAWKAGGDLDIAALIRQIQNPPFQQVGVIDLESFFPAKDRFALAMRLNNLLASPGFEAWVEGEPLDVDALLHTPDGKPRASILSIAHLSDAERMFFVSLLLNQVLGWVRTQPGTSSLRALLYMDEVFGYFPPVANPPSKLPLLTLLKQARAYGLGVVLATQNPVDLDYKGLSNTGTWFIGRLQAERDRARVLEGLEGAAAGGARFDRRRWRRSSRAWATASS